jgi:hypothetical protein
MKKDLILPRKVSEWMNRFNLHSRDSWTEAGIIAGPKDISKTLFTLGNRAETLSTLNSIYGLNLNESFFEVKGSSLYHKSLIDIEHDRVNIVKVKSILPEEFNLENDIVYIGGISIPDRSILYVEYSFLDRALLENYLKQDYRPNVLAGVEFIPLSKESFV